jgi:hypothetical protein
MQSVGGNTRTAVENLETVGEFADSCIAKADSTISGLELVTLPASLLAHQKHFDWLGLTEAMRGQVYGHGDSGSAGIHIHINAKVLTKLDQSKMIVFVNDVNHTRLIETIGQRSPNTYCQRLPKKIGGYVTGKYELINCNGSTVEVRFFNSSLMPDRILKNIEFCAALVGFVKDTSVRNLTEVMFCEYVHAERYRLPNLAKFMFARCGTYRAIADHHNAQSRRAA